MPATAGRVRMPANNRVHSSAALQTHGIWQSAIGYDPYAPSEKEKKAAVQAGREAGNSYDSFQRLLALARLTSSNASETRGACKICGRIGHLTFQSRNFLSLKDDLVLLPEPENESEEKDKDRMDNNGGDDEIRAGEKEGNSNSDEDYYSTDLTDSSEDSEIERIIAKRFGRKFGKRSGTKSRVSSEDDCEKNKDAEGRQKGRRRRRGKGEKGRASCKKWDKFRVSSDEEVEYNEDSDSEGNSEKFGFSSDDECEDSGSEARRRRKREIIVSSKKHDKSRDCTYEERKCSDYDDERDGRSHSRRQNSRVSKKYRVSRFPSNTEDSEHEGRKRVKSRRSSKRLYSCGGSSDSEGERNRRRKRREYLDEFSYYSYDEERKWKRSKCRRVGYSNYSENERRKRNGSCSTGSNSDSEEEMRRNQLGNK